MLKVWDIINWENIKIVVKKHSILNIFLWIIIIFTLIISFMLIYLYKNEILIYFYITLFLQFILLILYFFLIEKELDTIIITNSKLILINKKNTFERNYFEINLNEIKEIKATSKWFLANTLNYWTLNIILKNNLTFKLKYIPDIMNIAKNIIDLSK